MQDNKYFCFAGGMCRPSARHQRENKLSSPRTSLPPASIYLQDGRSGSESPGFEFGSMYLTEPLCCRHGPRSCVEAARALVTAPRPCPMKGFTYTYPLNINSKRTVKNAQDRKKATMDHIRISI